MTSEDWLLADINGYKIISAHAMFDWLPLALSPRAKRIKLVKVWEVNGGYHYVVRLSQTDIYDFFDMKEAIDMKIVQ